MSAAADSNPPGELYCTACEKTFHVGERCPTDGTRLLKLKARIDPFLGRDLDGRYTVLEKLGSGGMGAVYRAEQHSVDREVAIKVINSSLVSEPEVIKRFLREAKLATRFSHPNAVTVLDFGQTDDGVFFLVMELVSGRTLDDVIKSDRTFRAERLVRIGIQICEALEGAHALSIIHRDLKPSNIMLLAGGRDFVKVLDFGLAKSTSPDQTSTTMTGAGAVVGTPAFMPPELATGEPCDARSDLYSLGVILYVMGSGRLPFMSESVHELLSMHASTDPAPPMTGVPLKLARVIDKLLRKKPSERYQNATDARNALEESLIASTPAPVAEGMVQDTNPSLGPFPATTHQFAGLDTTPIPPSVVAAQSTNRKKPSSTAMDRIMTGETMLAGSGSAVAASQPGLDSTPGLVAPPKKRWPLFAIAGGVLATSVAVIVLAAGGGNTTSEPTTPPPKPPNTAVTPPEVETKPAIKTPDVETKPPDTAVKTPDTAVKTPDVETKPPTVKTTTKGSKGSKGTRGTKGGTTPAVTNTNTGPTRVPGNDGSGATKPPGTGSGTKPPALPF